MSHDGENIMVILSSPSGVGKTTLTKKIQQKSRSTNTNFFPFDEHQKNLVFVERHFKCSSNEKLFWCLSKTNFWCSSSGILNPAAIHWSHKKFWCSSNGKTNLVFVKKKWCSSNDILNFNIDFNFFNFNF